MIDGIIANGASGPATAALDVAVKLGLRYQGWIREGRPLPAKFRLQRVSGVSTQWIVEQSVGAAEGCLCFSDSPQPFLRLETIKNVALRLNKPFLWIVLGRESAFAASRRIAAWITDNRIRQLYVDGEAGTADPSLIKRVAGVLEASFFLTLMGTGPASPPSIADYRREGGGTMPPRSMDAALDHLEAHLPLKDKAIIANMAADELVTLQFRLGDYINTHFDVFTANTDLIDACRRHADNPALMPMDAAAVIIRALWERLRADYRIRIIK